MDPSLRQFALKKTRTLETTKSIKKQSTIGGQSSHSKIAPAEEALKMR